MEWFSQLLENRILVNGLIAWALAQILKALIVFVMEKRFSFERLFGDGGFPSGHSATVCSVAATAGFLFGLDSFQFAIAVILAIIVMHDATGVRLETGKQAEVLNSIVEFLQKDIDLTDYGYLKELVGHTPIQVCGGAILGITVAVLLH